MSTRHRLPLRNQSHWRRHRRRRGEQALPQPVAERASPQIRWSDHLRLRVLERMLGIDVDAADRYLEDSLLRSDSTRKALAFVGNAPFRLNIGEVTFCGRNRVVTTCYRRKGGAGAES